MESDSELSEKKKTENKSILKFNYIYKKSEINNFRNSISAIKTLNYEKIAKHRMKNMNIKFLLSSIYKLKNTINGNNPLFKYIKNVQSYQNKTLKINIAENKPILNLFFKNNIKKKYPKNEKILSFSSCAKNYRNFYYSRMSNIECKKINNNKIEKIILIQKNIRRFLNKKIFDEEVNKIIVKIIINKILKLQKAIRKFLNKKKSLLHYIVNIIKNERYSESNKITDIFSLFHFRNFYKKKLLIQKIIKTRHECIIKIQHKFKSYMLIKKVKNIIKKEKNSYVLTYPFSAESVQIKIYLDTSFRIYDFFICPIRKYFVLYIEKGTLIKREYLCHIIVNNNVILDKRYKYIVDKNNILYNLIYIGETQANENNDEVKDKINEIPKKDKKEKKKKKKKNINKNENDDDNDFFYYCYNENSNSTESYSGKSDHLKKKSQDGGGDMSKKKNDDNINIDKNLENQFGKNNMKKNMKKKVNLDFNKFFEFFNVNKKSKKLIRNNDFEKYFKKKILNKKEIKDNDEYIYENHTSQNSYKEESIQSEKIKYISILDELSQHSSSSLSRSNMSMRNLNAYSKQTHQAKFCPEPIKKKTSNNNVFHNSDNIKDLFMNTINKNKYKSIKIKK